jgi:hypothetical protein
MTTIRRLEKLEDAMLRQGGANGYKLAVTSERRHDMKLSKGQH